jgi:hypothetical protein
MSHPSLVQEVLERRKDSCFLAQAFGDQLINLALQLFVLPWIHLIG